MREGAGSPPPVPVDAIGRAGLIRLLRSNRISTHVAHACARRPDLQLDTAFLDLLREDARGAAEQGLVALAALRDIDVALQGAGIPWLLWKGPALSAQLWSEATRRRFTDLDVVVPPVQGERAREALARAGWRMRDELGPRSSRLVYAATQAYPLDRANAPLVELHWGFAGRMYPETLRVEAVLARAETVSVAGRPVRTPAGADALLLLAMHATKHGWSQAEEVLSFARLAAREAPAMEGARAAARSAGIPRVIALAERLAARLGVMGAAQPELVAVHSRAAESPEHDAVDAMAEACLARMLAGDGAWRHDARWTLWWMGDPRDRLRHLAGRLWRPTPLEPRWLRLPDAFASAYPVVRLARLALRSVGLTR